MPYLTPFIEGGVLVAIAFFEVETYLLAFLSAYIINFNVLIIRVAILSIWVMTNLILVLVEQSIITVPNSTKIAGIIIVIAIIIVIFTIVCIIM